MSMIPAPLLAVQDLRKVYTRGLLDRTPRVRTTCAATAR
jgi:hypothetical protein